MEDKITSLEALPVTTELFEIFQRNWDNWDAYLTYKKANISRK